MIEILNVRRYEHMASGRNYCALAECGGRKTTAFGKTKEEAEENVRIKLAPKPLKKKKKR